MAKQYSMVQQHRGNKNQINTEQLIGCVGTSNLCTPWIY